MPIEPLLLVGAGGHARVVLDAVRRRDAASVVAIADDNRRLEGRRFSDLIIRTPIDWSRDCQTFFHVAIGHNGTRSRCHADGIAARRTALTVIHPDATVSPDAQIGAGTFVAARAVVAPSASVGLGVIVNHGAVVDHDCNVGEFAHVAPLAALGGGVKVGHRVLVGAGAVVLPGLTIGDGATIGAGAVVVRDVEAGAIVAGVPAQTMVQHE